jgi:peptide/nickel transport system substrate-binding protein
MGEGEAGMTQRLIKTVFLALAVLAALPAARAESVLRVAMTVSDVPLTTGNPDQGAEGMLMVGYNLYDALVNWDLSRADVVAPLTPGLATEWHVDPADNKKWLFSLRQGVMFHDGSAFDADAVVWNFDKILNDKAPQYDAKQAGQARGRIPTVAGYRKLDAGTVEISTSVPDAFLPYQVTWILFSSPAQYEKLGRSWDKFASEPSGTGPFKAVKFAPRERLEMVPNQAYWDPKRVPKLDRLIVMPVPEASARTAALRSGQVDWIEAPAPDAIPSMRQAGFEIVTNAYPHAWVYDFSKIEGSPFADVRVRKAANLAVNREGLKQLLGGLALPARGIVTPNSPWFGAPSFDVKYDPDAAKALMKEAGYGPDKPLAVTVVMAANGSGQMQPQPMNEYIQENLAAVGIKVELEAVDWSNMLSRWRSGARAEANKGVGAVQTNMIVQDPITPIVRFADSRLVAPKGVNFGEFKDPETDALIDRARLSFDIAEQNRLLGQIHARLVDQASFLFVVHDVSPRAISPKVKDYVQAQSWYQDFTRVRMAP